jgi:hypothetical protein
MVMAIGRNNTTVVREDDGSVVVTLHSTHIVKIDGGGIVTLDSGGYMTNTTKTRMNQVAEGFHLNFAVYQRNHQWYVKVPGGDLDFEDGMTI